MTQNDAQERMMRAHRGLETAGTALYCTAAGIIAVSLSLAVAREVGSTGAVANLIPFLVGVFVTVVAGYFADRLLPWLRGSR